jgi:hypothetical protein
MYLADIPGVPGIRTGVAPIVRSRRKSYDVGS